MKKIIKALILTMCVSMVFGLIACTKSGGEMQKYDSDEITIESVGDVKPCTALNWMGGIRDDTLISDFSIPATHDSGAYNAIGINIFGQTQSLYIDEQLSAGVRGFDIRLVYTGTGFKLYHGVLDVNLTFDEVCKSFSDFLSANPTEALVMSVKQEDDDEPEVFNDALKTLLQSNSHLFFLENRIPTLGEVRGKVVFVRRFAASYDFGIDLTGWQGDTTFEINNEVTAFVQDNYALDDGDTIETKLEDFEALYDLVGTQTGVLVINHLSAYTEQVIGRYEIPMVKQAAEILNERILPIIERIERRNLGLVYCDFISEELAKVIYEKNFDSMAVIEA